MALSVVIIDHEPLMAAQLKKCLLAVDPDITVVAICYEGEQAAACLHEYKPDLVFLTIEMPRIGGLAIAKAIQGMEGDRPDIVFVTGQRDFVSHTLRLTALDYLVKPVTEGEVAQAVRKFRALHIKKEPSPREDSLADTSADDGPISLPTRRFSVDEGEKIKLIACEDIRLIYAEKRRTFLVTLEGKTYPTHFSLIQFEQRLPASVFFCCHRNYIVNIDEVRQIEPWFNHQYVLILQGQEKEPIPVGRSYIKKLRQYIYL